MCIEILIVLTGLYQLIKIDFYCFCLVVLYKNIFGINKDEYVHFCSIHYLSILFILVYQSRFSPLVQH